MSRITNIAVKNNLVEFENAPLQIRFGETLHWILINSEIFRANCCQQRIVAFEHTSLPNLLDSQTLLIPVKAKTLCVKVAGARRRKCFRVICFACRIATNRGIE